MSGYLVGIALLLCINVIFAYGVYLPVATGQLNLGGAGFQALGAYAAAYASTAYDLPPVLTIPLAAALGGLVGAAIALPVLRTRGAYMVLATIAFTQVVAGAILATPALGGAAGIPVPTYVGAAVIVPLTIATVLGCLYLMSTRLGLVMRSVHDDEVVSDLLGVNVRGVQVFAFALGGLLAGLSGGLYAHQFGFVEAQSFNDLVSVNVLLFVLLGGVQTAWGPLVGTIFFTLAPEAMRNLLPSVSSAFASLFHGAGLTAVKIDDGWRFVALGLFTIVMMIYRSEGVVTRGLLRRLAFR